METTKRSNPLLEKSFQFALITISVFKKLTEEKKEYIMSRQLLKSGTSIGANVKESNQAESTADFIHKLSISLKEAHECEYWIELLSKSSYLDSESYVSLHSQLNEIISLLTSIIKTTKVKLRGNH